MIRARGRSEEAVRCRIRCAWCKFNELAPMLTKPGLSLKMKGNLYDTYVGNENMGNEKGGQAADDKN